ncbi:MAG: DUF5667 domain-containing protein [Actinomycetota bacterium]|nr:DUF5667 domain-containing protein [Actinomycetota bacterium]
MSKHQAHDKKLENALDYCVRLLNSGSTIDECLKLYPNQRKELKGLLEAALSVKEAYPDYPELRPSKLYAKTGKEQFLAAAKGDITAAIRTASAKRISHGESAAVAAGLFNVRTIYKRALFVSSVAAAALIILAGGLIYASADSLPGSPLYGVKRAVESIQLALTFDSKSKAKLYREFAQRRIDEARQIAKAGEKKRADQAYKEAQENVDKAEKIAKTLPADQEPASKGEKSSTQPGKENKEEKVNTPGAAAKISKSDKGESDKGDSNKVAENVENRSSAKSGSAVDDNALPGAVGSSSRPISSKKRISVSGGKSTASVGSFEIASIRADNEYISPNGDGVKDGTLIEIQGATKTGFNVDLYDGTEKVATIAEEITKPDFKFTWNGKDIDGNAIPDGEYTLVVSDKQGRIASKKAAVVIDTKAPRVALVAPKSGEIIDDSRPLFSWLGLDESGDIEYNLYIIPTHDLGVNAKYISGLSSLLYKPSEDLKPGMWQSRVTAIDKAGNVGSSKLVDLLIIKSATNK